MWFKGFEKGGPGDREDEIEEPGCGGREGHSLGADVQRVGFGGVGEGDGAFAGGVDDAEEVEADGDAGRLGGAGGDPEAEAGEEEAEGHEGEGGQEKVAAAEGVDCVHWGRS